MTGLALPHCSPSPSPQFPWEPEPGADTLTLSLLICPGSLLLSCCGLEQQRPLHIGFLQDVTPQGPGIKAPLCLSSLPTILKRRLEGPSVSVIKLQALHDLTGKLCPLLHVIFAPGAESYTWLM